MPDASSTLLLGARGRAAVDFPSGYSGFGGTRGFSLRTARERALFRASQITHVRGRTGAALGVLRERGWRFFCRGCRPWKRCVEGQHAGVVEGGQGAGWHIRSGCPCPYCVDLTRLSPIVGGPLVLEPGRPPGSRYQAEDRRYPSQSTVQRHMAAAPAPCRCCVDAALGRMTITLVGAVDPVSATASFAADFASGNLTRHPWAMRIAPTGQVGLPGGEHILSNMAMICSIYRPRAMKRCLMCSIE